MKSIDRNNFNALALRFSDNFAPLCGTIEAHRLIIEKLGYVWYGKLGSAISFTVAKKILSQDEPKILLIRSGKQERYWASVSEITNTCPVKEEIPEYYREKAGLIKTWFKITDFSLADREVMAHCIVASSGESLSKVSRSSMCPYFIIFYKNEQEGV